MGASAEPNSDPVPQKMISKSFILMQSMTPEWLGRKINVDIVQIIKKYAGFSNTITELKKQPPFFEELKGI